MRFKIRSLLYVKNERKIIFIYSVKEEVRAIVANV